MPKYSFEKGRKGECPECKHHNVFRFYEGFDHSLGLGICDRKNNCGYHARPENGQIAEKKIEPQKNVQVVQVFVPEEEVQELMKHQDTPFHKWCLGLGISSEHLLKWGVGGKPYGKKGEKSTVFVMRGADDKAWNIKTMRYGEDGKRIGNICSLKQPESPGAYFAPLFGVNLLRKISQGIIVCLVESEKTAIVASFFYPQYDWVACASNLGLTEEKAKMLTGRTVWNLRDADIAGRSTCSGKRLENCSTPLQCSGCKNPHIEKQLFRYGITFYYADLFPEKNDGYDLADAISDGHRPRIEEYIAVSELTTKAAKETEASEDEEERVSLGIPSGVDLKFYREFGFYEYGGKYFMRTQKDGFQAVSNFTMKVLYLTTGANPKRVIEINNIWGKKRKIELAIADLISVARFKERIESIGNFLWYGTDANLMSLKNMLYQKEISAHEITELGWQRKYNLWAWANGIIDPNTGAFIPINEDGMVAVPAKNDEAKETVKDIAKETVKDIAEDAAKDWLYIPAWSKANLEKDTEMFNAKKFSHINITDNVSFEKWSTLFQKVYGDNGSVGIAFYFVAIFRDIVFESVRCNPMLFLFGRKGSGKGTMAKSLMHLFGDPQDQLMLGGASTSVGFMRKLAQLYDALVWLDEYKNSIDIKKIESLKNIWDGIGYERGQKSNNNLTETVPIRSTVILSGQEMPNIEPALFSRIILLEFKKSSDYTEEQTQLYNSLVEMETDGITSVSNEVLKYRTVVQEKFRKEYLKVSEFIREMMSGRDILERSIQNSSIVVAIYRILEDAGLKMPVTWHQLFEILYNRMIEQSRLMTTANEVQSFWNIIAFLLENGTLKYGRDLEIKGETVQLRLVSVMAHYREAARKQGTNPMDQGSLVQYFKACESYDAAGSEKHKRFSGLKNPTTCSCFFLSKIQKVYGLNLWDFVKESDTNEVEEQALAEVDMPDF